VNLKNTNEIIRNKNNKQRNR